MGSSVSTLNNYSGIPLFTFGNKEILRLGMASMQGQVNENRTKLTSLVDQLALDIDVARPIDQQYLQERLQQTVDIVNQYSAGDISNPALMGQLTSKLKESIDERVYNGVAAASLRNKDELPQWQEAKKKGDGSFSDKNYAYASQSWNKYMQSTDPNETYNGGGGFIKYVDYDKRLMDDKFIKSLEGLGITAKYVVREDGGRYFDYVNTMEGTTDKNRLMQAVQAQIGEDGFKQMDINAWAKYGDASNPQVVDNMRSNYNGVIDTVNQRTSEELGILQGQINSVPQAQKALYQQRIDELQQTLEDNKGRNFDTEVVDAEGYLDPNKYEALYKGFNRKVEFERLTNLTYQPPRMIETKVEDVKLNVLKYQENVRHSLEMEQQGRDGLYLETLQAEADGLIQPKNPTNSIVNADEIKFGADQQISDEETGTYNQQTKEREAQTTAVAGVNGLVDGAMGKGDTAKLVQDLAGVDIGSLAEVTIAGRTVAITDANRAQVYTALDNFKKTMVDGTATIRYVRGEMSKLIDQTVGNLSQHYANNKSDQRDLAFTKDNFYFVKTANGNYEYRSGLMPGAKESNYNLLMYKKAKGQKLTVEDEMALSTYVTNGIVSDKGLKLTDWEKQQLYATNQEKIVKNIGAKAANTMPTYSTYEKQSNKTFFLGQVNGNASGKGDELVTEITRESANKYKSGGKRVIEGVGEFEGKFFREAYKGISQDTEISGLGFTDGFKNGRTSLTKRLDAISNLTKVDMADKSVGLRVTPLNIPMGSGTAKRLETKYGTKIEGVAQLYPKVTDGKATGEWELYTDVTTGTGKDKKTTKTVSKDKDGNAITFTSEDLGIDAADYYNTPYNATLGERAATVELGGSGYAIYQKGDSRNVKPSDNFVSNVNVIQKVVSQDPNATNYFNNTLQAFKDGDIKFYIKTVGNSGTYYNVMQTKDGQEIVISDTGKKILSQKDDLPQIYGGSKLLKEDLITTYLLNYFQIKL